MKGPYPESPEKLTLEGGGYLGIFPRLPGERPLEGQEDHVLPFPFGSRVVVQDVEAGPEEPPSGPREAWVGLVVLLGHLAAGTTVEGDFYGLHPSLLARWDQAQ